MKTLTEAQCLYAGCPPSDQSQSFTPSVAGGVIKPQGMSTLNQDASADAVKRFEDAILEELSKEYPSDLTTCDRQFGFLPWEFATHCGSILSDNEFPIVSLTDEQRSVIDSFSDSNSRLEVDVTTSQTFTSTFADTVILDGDPSVDGVPREIDIALFGLSAYVSDAMQESFNVLYADGAWPLVLAEDSATVTPSGVVQAEYELRGSAKPLTRMAAILQIGRAYRLATALTEGPAVKDVYIGSFVKFTTGRYPAPSDIQSVAYDITIGDMTFSSE